MNCWKNTFGYSTSLPSWKALFVVILWSWPNLAVRAESFIRFEDVNAPKATFSVSTRQYQVFSPGGQDGTTIANQVQFYFPAASTGSTKNHVYTSDTTLLEKDQSGHTLRFSLRISHDKTNAQDIIFAVKKEADGPYSVVGKVVQGLSRGSEYIVTIAVSFQTLCASDSELDCTNFAASSALETSDNVEGMFYFCEGSTCISDTKRPDDIENELHVELNFSNKTSELTSGPSVVSSSAGDQRLKIKYTGRDFVDFREVYVIGANRDDLTAAIDGENVYDSVAIGATFFNNSLDFRNPEGAEATIKDFLKKSDASTISTTEREGIANGTTYEVGLFAVNKYGLASAVSQSVDLTPESILTTLKKNQCYLITAGFGENHKVIDFYRSIRDRFLLKFTLGRLFVHFYYETAPKYAIKVYQSTWLSQLVRIFSWIGLGLFYYFSLFMSATVFIIGGGLFFRARQVKHQ